MTVVRGNTHTYVGIEIYYSTPGEEIVYMDSYITEAVDGFPEETKKYLKRRQGTTFSRLTTHM